MSKRFLASILLVVFAAVPAVLATALPASAAVPVNFGFESGDLTGWSTYLSVNGSVSVDTASPSPAGGYYAHLNGPDDGCLDCNPPDGVTLSQTFSGTAGQVVSGYARFSLQDSYPDGGAVAFMSVGNDTVYQASSSTGWTAWTYTIPSDGSYTLQAVVYNGGDNALGSALDFDGGPICTILGTDGKDSLTGTSGDDVICGLGSKDVIRGLGGNDILRGGDGPDKLFPGSGDDSIDGGASTQDVVSFLDSASGVTVDLSTGTGSGDGSDTLSGVESVRGSTRADTITGDAENNSLFGDKGGDSIVGGDGDDVLNGTYGSDTLDAVDAVSGNDSVIGGNKPASAIDTCTYDVGDAIAGCEA